MVFGQIGNFIKNHKNTIGKALISGLSNTKFGKIAQKTYNDWSSGQYHLPGHNYCGSGTKLEGQKPTNKTDSACQKHDYAYDEIQKNKKDIDRNDLKQRVRNADIELINDVKNENSLGSKIVGNAIKLKNWAEDKGIINHELFI